MSKVTERAVLENRLNERLSRHENSNALVLNAIENEGNNLVDFIAPIGIDNKNNMLTKFHSNGAVKLQLEQGDEYTLHPHAVSQAGSRLGIPTRYIKDLAYGGEQWQRDLAAHSLNTHSEHTARQRMLFRAVDGEVRGILSDSYRRLNTKDIYANFLKSSMGHGATVWDVSKSDTKSWVEMVIPQIIEVPTEKNGMVSMIFGLRISNSDFGSSSLEVRAFHTQVVCLNGMVRNSIHKQVHLGSKIPDNLSVSNETYMLDTQTQASLVKDIVDSQLSKSAIELQVADLQLAGSMTLDIEREIKMLPKLGVLKNEVSSLEQIMMANKPEDGVQGEGTLFKLTQSLSAVARDADTSRAKELMEISGKIFDSYTAKARK